MPIPKLPPLGSMHSTLPTSPASLRPDRNLPVPDVAADPTQLVARALAILVEETDLWEKRKVTSTARTSSP